MAIVVYENIIEQVCNNSMYNYCNKLTRNREPAKKFREVKVSCDIILVWRRQKLGDKDNPVDAGNVFRVNKRVYLHPLVKYAFLKPKNGVRSRLSSLCQNRICKRRPYKGGIYLVQGRCIGKAYPKAREEEEQMQGGGDKRLRTEAGQDITKTFPRKFGEGFCYLREINHSLQEFNLAQAKSKSILRLK